MSRVVMRGCFCSLEVHRFKSLRLMNENQCVEEDGCVVFSETPVRSLCVLCAWVRFFYVPRRFSCVVRSFSAWVRSNGG